MMRKCLSLFGSCFKKPDKPTSPPPQQPPSATPTTTANINGNPTGLITMTYPDPDLNRSSYPLRPIPERRSSKYHSVIQRNNMHSNNMNSHHHRRTQHRRSHDPRNSTHLGPLESIVEDSEEKRIGETGGNPSEKDFAAEKIAVRDFGVEAAERLEGKKLCEEGLEISGFGFEAKEEPESSGQVNDKEKGKDIMREPVMEDGKGKGKEVARDPEDDTGEA